MLSTPHVLWVINAALLVLTLILARDVVGTRVQRHQEDREAILESVVKDLSDRPSSEELQRVWADVLLDVSLPEIPPAQTIIRAIAVLDAATDSNITSMREVVTRHINILNDAAAYIDEGLLRPRDIVKYYPSIHSALLTDLAMMVPFIWYQSLLRGRGRWGYRIVRLKAIMEELRAVSPREDIRGPLVVAVADLQLLSLPGLPTFQRLRRLARLWVRSPTIDVHSKLGQLKERDRLARQLRLIGLSVVQSRAPENPINW